MSNDERERVRRIQEAHMKSRDPGPSKTPKYDFSKEKPKYQQRPLLFDLIDVFPASYKGAALGALLGLIIAVIMKIGNTEAGLLGLGVILVFGVVGWIVGMTIK